MLTIRLAPPVLVLVLTLAAAVGPAMSAAPAAPAGDWTADRGGAGLGSPWDGPRRPPRLPIPGDVSGEPRAGQAAPVSPLAGAVSPDNGRTAAAVVLFDPRYAVAGSGWFLAPAGSLPAEPGTSGIGVFSFSAAYPPGTSRPAGSLSLQLLGTGFAFEASSFEWLFATPTSVRLFGTGSVAGRPGFAFQLTATPGGMLAARVRLHVYDLATGLVVFDNEPGSPPDDPPTTALLLGSISVTGP